MKHLCLASALLVGCADGGVDAPPVETPAPGDDGPVDRDPMPTLPAGLELPSGHLFSVNTSRSVFAIPIAGDSGHELLGRLRPFAPSDPP